VYTHHEGPPGRGGQRPEQRQNPSERANLRAHQAVLKRLMAATTPLPMAFGTVAANPEAIHKILIRSRSAFEKQFARVAGKGGDGAARHLGRAEYL